MRYKLSERVADVPTYHVQAMIECSERRVGTRHVTTHDKAGSSGARSAFTVSCDMHVSLTRARRHGSRLPPNGPYRFIASAPHVCSAARFDGPNVQHTCDVIVYFQYDTATRIFSTTAARSGWVSREH